MAGVSVNTATPFSYDPYTVTALVPANGPTNGGTTLLVVGRNFGPNSITISPLMGALNCAYLSHNDTHLRCTTPASSGGSFTVSLSKTPLPDWPAQGSPRTFVYDAPAISSISPTQLNTTGSQTFVISGSNFGNSISTIVVRQSGTPLSCVLTTPHTTLTCTSVAGQGSNHNLVVQVASVSSPQFAFSFVAPLISSIVPSSLFTTGGVITVSGSNFGQTPVVYFGGSIISCSAVPPPLICTVPAGDGMNIPISVNVSDLNIAAAPFSFSYNAPVINSFSPVTGNTTGGYSVVLNGANLGPNSGSPNQVSVELLNCYLSDDSDVTTQLTGTWSNVVVGGGYPFSFRTDNNVMGNKAGNTITYFPDVPAGTYTLIVNMGNATGAGLATNVDWTVYGASQTYFYSANQQVAAVELGYIFF